jgi:HSP20 family protein
MTNRTKKARPQKTQTAEKTKSPAPTTEVTPVKALAPRRAVPADLFRPFGMMRRLAEEMDRIFDEFRSSFPRFEFPRPLAEWAPAVEVSERGGNLVVRAELPGLSRNDVKVEVREDVLAIQGERRHEREERKKGVFRSERSYGSFYREIPLPEGIDPAAAKATFKNGVLEVTMPAPPRPAKGRRVPIETA